MKTFTWAMTIIAVATLAFGQEPALSDVERARLDVAKLQVEVARLTREVAACTAERVDMMATKEVAAFLASIEKAYPGYTLDAASGKLVPKAPAVEKK